MSMNRKPTAQDNVRPKDLSELNQPQLEQWLDKAISAKALQLAFDSSTKDNPYPTINLSRFGLRNPNDIKVFLLSPAGETVKRELGEQIAFEQSTQEQLRLEQQEEVARRHRLKAVLFLWLIEKKGHAAHQLRELIEEQNEKAIKQSSSPNAPQETKPALKLDNALQQTLANYDKAIRSFQDEHRQLENDEIALRDKLITLRQHRETLDLKHAAYGKSMEEFSLVAEQHEASSMADLDTQINAVEQDIMDRTERVLEVLDSGDEKQARELLAQQNAANLKLASLYDIRSRLQEEKHYYNALGEQVSSLKEAEFVVKRDQKVVVKNGKYYLLKADEELDKLPQSRKEEAESQFKRAKPELMTVHKAVKHTMELERKFHEERVDDTTRKIDVNRDKQLQVKNQINLLQSSRATAQAALTQPTLGPASAPSMSSSSSSAHAAKTVPVSVVTFFMQQRSILSMPRLTPHNLFDLINKTVSDPKAKAEILKYLRSVLPLDKIPSTSPLPQTTMTSLLQNMERFGARAYKVGPAQSPMDSAKRTEEPQRRFNPTPFSTDPFKS